MISGLQKMTLLDYPGKIACTVFLQGCNFRCPFCHNSDLLPRDGQELMTEEEFLTFLRKRQGLLDAVCVSGGEPTLYPRLPQFMRAIKDLGYLVKLDTNGSNPGMLKSLAAEGLLDYVAMDVKNSPSRYGEITGLPGIRLDTIEESLRFLLSGAVDYELRTTVVAQFHNADAVLEMGQWLRSLVPGVKPRALYLQSFVDRDSVIYAGLTPPSKEQMQEFVTLLAPFVEKVTLRNP